MEIEDRRIDFATMSISLREIKLCTDELLLRKLRNEMNSKILEHQQMIYDLEAEEYSTTKPSRERIKSKYNFIHVLRVYIFHTTKSINLLSDDQFYYTCAGMMRAVDKHQKAIEKRGSKGRHQKEQKKNLGRKIKNQGLNPNFPGKKERMKKYTSYAMMLYVHDPKEHDFNRDIEVRRERDQLSRQRVLLSILKRDLPNEVFSKAIAEMRDILKIK